MGVGGVFKAEFLAQYWWLKNNRSMLVLWLVWPYLTVLILYTLGTSFGSLENLKVSLGVDDPLLYLFAASNIAFAASGLVDTVSGVATWHRWIGTLPYIYVSPNRFAVYLTVGGFAGSIYNVFLNYVFLLPGVLIYSGLRGGIGLTVVLLVMLLGALPLIGIALAAALLSLIAREEGNVLSFLNPLLLLLSGVFYPLTILPQILQAMSVAVPVRYVVEAARLAASFSEGPGAALYFAAYTLALMVVVYNTLSLALVSRAERAARLRGVFAG